MNPYSQNMPGVPPMGYPAPQLGFGSNPGYPPTPQGYHPQNAPASQPGFGYNPGYPQVPQGCHPQNPVILAQAYPQLTQGYPQLNQGYPQPNQFQGQSAYNHPQGQYNHSQNGTAPFNNYSSSINLKKSKPTLLPAQSFDPKQDAAALRKAMKGFGTDEKAIINILTRRTNEQRQRIIHEYKTVIGKDLVTDLRSETSGRFRDLLVAMMTPMPQFYAKELHDAIAGLGTDEEVLIEIMCTMSNHEIKKIKEAYSTLYKNSLEDDIKGDTSGYFKKFLKALCSDNIRSENYMVNKQKAQEDAKSLQKAGVKRVGTDESVFIDILTTRSQPQLAAVFEEYQLLTGRDIDTDIKSEFSGHIEKALRTLVMAVRSKPLFFAESLHKSMKGLGTNDRQLIRIMATRCEIDLEDIAEIYQTKYMKSLKSWIEGDCSGHYKKCLIALLGH